MKTYIIELFDSKRLKIIKGIAELTNISLNSVRILELKIAQAKNIHVENDIQISMKLTKGFMIVDFNISDEYIIINMTTDIEDESFEKFIKYYADMFKSTHIKYTVIIVGDLSNNLQPETKILDFESKLKEEHKKEEKPKKKKSSKKKSTKKPKA